MQIIDAVYYTHCPPRPDRRAPWKLIYAHARHAHTPPLVCAASFHHRPSGKGYGIELKTNSILILLPAPSPLPPRRASVSPWKTWYVPPCAKTLTIPRYPEDNTLHARLFPASRLIRSALRSLISRERTISAALSGYLIPNAYIRATWERCS